MSTLTSKAFTNSVALTIACVGVFMSWGHAQQMSRVTTDTYRQLPWRYIGPEGNRVIAVAGVSGDPLVYYAGAATGGIWKSSDGGQFWEPVFDEQQAFAIGALAVSPSDPNVVWAGTGETFLNARTSLGMGVYKSSDAGRSWTQVGLEKSGRIGRLVADPANADVLFACALGHASGPQPERGVFRTVDGGRTWERVLFVDENTGCSDLAMNVKNPRILLAGMWQLRLNPWGPDSGGPGSGLFLSRDGGATWNRLTNGLPKQEPGVGKIAVAIAPSNPNRMYALIDTAKGKDKEPGEEWRSDDGGETWRMINAQTGGAISNYYTRMTVAPDNENETYYLTGRFTRSIDGGVTLVDNTRWYDGPGADHHDMWIDPTNPNRWAVAHDLGVAITLTRGRAHGWNRVILPIAQMYHVAVDNQIPYKVYSNRQDGPGYVGISNSRRGAAAEIPIWLSGGGGDPRITRNYWHTINNGENGWAMPDPVNPDVVWTTGSGQGSIGGMVQRYEESRRQWRTVEVWPDQASGPSVDLKYRFHWIMATAISPHDRNKIYVGSQYVHQTTDAGQSWQVISPDLTLNDKSHQTGAGGGGYYESILVIAESPREKGLIWAGTNDAQVQITRDGGKTWTNVSKHLNTLASWGSVESIEPSRYDAATAYLTIDFHLANNRDPFVYRTRDYGKSWTLITKGIPHGMLSYAHCIKEDPVRPGLLYLGTENGMHLSFDDGENWEPLQMNLPPAPVYGIAVQERFHDLVIATYGRGIWILDDLTPLQQLTAPVLTEAAHLFAPLPAYRYRQITNDSVIHEDELSAGNDPPYGAGINYYLGTAPAGKVTVTILDQKGEAVRIVDGTKNVGVNRVHWDLRYEPNKPIMMRTALIGAGAANGRETWRSSDGGQLSILAPPGSYTVKLSAGGRELTQPLTVIKDPHSGGTEADIQAQMTTLFELRRAMDRAANLVNGIEMARSQIDQLARVLDDQTLKSAATELNHKLIAVEQNVVEVYRVAPAGAKLARKLSYLASQLASSDFKPTNQQLEVKRLLEERLATYEGQYDTLRTRDLTAFNELLRERKMSPITTGAVP